MSHPSVDRRTNHLAANSYSLEDQVARSIVSLLLYYKAEYGGVVHSALEDKDSPATVQFYTSGSCHPKLTVEINTAKLGPLIYKNSPLKGTGYTLCMLFLLAYIDKRFVAQTTHVVRKWRTIPILEADEICRRIRTWNRAQVQHHE